MASWNRLDKETKKNLTEKFDKIFKKIKGDRYFQYNSQYGARMWWLVGKKIAKMEDDMDTYTINRLYEEIQRQIRRMDKDYMDKQYGSIDELHIIFHLETGILDIPRDDLENLFRYNPFLLSSQQGDPYEIGKKLKSTYNYFKDEGEATSDEDKLFRIKAYYNVFAVYPAGREFIFEEVELTIFPPEAKYKMNYNYNYNKKRPYDDSGSDGGSTRTKTKRRYGGDGSGSDGGSTRTTKKKTNLAHPTN